MVSDRFTETLTGIGELDKLLYKSGRSQMKTTVNKKTYHLDEALIEKVRHLFNVKTSAEAIQKALEKTLDDREIEESLDRLLRDGRFRTIYR